MSASPGPQIPFRVRRGLPAPEAFAHGTRARYVTGCRCEDCRASNRRYYHEREARGRALAAEISAPAMPAPQEWTAPDGARRIRVYKRACPGVEGEPCPLRAHLRRDSKGGVCRACRHRLAWNGLVSTAAASAHVRKLGYQGVGYKSVAAAASVGVLTVWKIRSGERMWIRAATERRILAVDAEARADASTVPAGSTWRLVRLLLDEGYTKARLARELGAQTPALQLGRRRVLAITAVRVQRLYHRLTA